MRCLLLACAVLTLAGCDGDSPAGPTLPRPEVESSDVTANPHNVLSAVVSARIRNADSVMVRYTASRDLLAEATPAAVTETELITLPVLGLRPETDYALQVIAFGREAASGEMLAFRTGPLPDDLPAYTANGADPTPGYVVIAAGPYGLVLDNTGRVVWYHRFPRGPGLNFQAQPNGRFVARPPPADPERSEPWVEIDPLGAVTRTLDCAGGWRPRFHDLLARPDGSYWILCDETRTVDLSRHSGSAAARVVGTIVQHIGPDGALLFQWSPFDHFEIGPVDPADITDNVVNWTHGNALDLDADGQLLVSFRNLSQVAKIDPRTGQVVWRMGGAGNQFAFQDEPAAFGRQHGLRVTGTDRFVLLDNLGDAGESRAERYVYDPVRRSARRDASYGSEPPVVAHLGGTTQPLPDGRTLVSFGNGGRVEEYDSAGQVVWRMDAPGYVFRAQRIRSLYTPGTGYGR
jgi:hypothetical protein